jgi:kanamycin nucleotidyltransferase
MKNACLHYSGFQPFSPRREKLWLNSGMQPHFSGPQAFTQSQRRHRCEAIVTRLKKHYGEELLALGLYGSHGRGDDGPYSDIELHCLLHGEEIDTVFEWSEGAWKAEVDVYSADAFLAAAGELDEFWPITQSAFTQVVPLYDPEGLFPRARQAVFDHSAAEFDAQMREVLVGDLYEVIGKARNAIDQRRPSSLAGEAVDAARYAACLLGLAHRKLFTTGPAALPEALLLPERPAGFDEFARLVLSGDLRDARMVATHLDTLWQGMEVWAAARGLILHRRFEDLLTHP